jgi:mono/diheme cytochrome c family protein
MGSGPPLLTAHPARESHTPMRWTPPTLAAALILAVNIAGAADASHDNEQIRRLLARHCLGCHAGEKPKGDLRLDRLSADFADQATREQWLTVLKRVKAGEMPPKGKPRPSPEEVRVLGEWISGRVAASDRRAAQGRVVLRRLNRAEYQNTVRDLLGVDLDLKEMLPEDMAANGFDNVGKGLHLSSFLLERYLEAADQALDIAIANEPQPPLIKKRYHCTDERHVKITKERVFLKHDGALVCFSSSAWQAIILRQFYPPDRGKYRFRLFVSGYQSDHKPVVFRVDAGRMLKATKSHLIGYFDAPADRPTVVEFTDDLEARSTIRILPYGLASAQAVNKVGAENYKGPGLTIHSIEVEGPLNDTWPPESHRRIFADLPQKPAPVYRARNRVEVASQNPTADVERILRAFARRAFRRPVSEADLQPILALVQAKLAQGHSFEQAVRVGLKAVMISPDFLFLREKPGKLDDFALASRLSYFLWSTMPDETLLALAEQNKLSEPDTLRQQVERMLDDPKSAAFTENFVGQWLGLRDIDFTEPSHILYPEFDHMLKVSMVRESELFFAELLKHDLSLTNIVASDFSMLNGRLAKHYGIPGVEGWEFRKVHLPPESHRGGVLTMASVLKVTANGTTTSPVLRGAWVLERILGTPPPPPPGNVAAIVPDIRGATTIREQLARHRQVASCANCHAKIDPPGFALESFDVIGGWRDHYRTTGRGKPVYVAGQRMHYLQGPKVDPSDVLPDGRRFENINEFKQLLLQDKDQIARALTEKLLTYATGGPPTLADQPEVEAIVGKLREKNYGLRSLVHEIVQSKAFQYK